jgi:hypothetical protein
LIRKGQVYFSLIDCLLEEFLGNAPEERIGLLTENRFMREEGHNGPNPRRLAVDYKFPFNYSSTLPFCLIVETLPEREATNSTIGVWRM